MPQNEPEPLFPAPVAWQLAREQIPGILEKMASLPAVAKALHEAYKSRHPTIVVYLMPDEAQAVWSIFNGPAVQERAKGNLRNVASRSTPKRKMGKNRKNPASKRKK